MGVASSTANAAERLPVGMNNLVGELGNDIHYEKGMGSSRFLKAIKARHRHGPLVVKTFVKPEAFYSLRILVRRLRIEREALADVPNTLTYQKVIETETAGYLIRQWMSTNLYDRISTRPFLTPIEKKWITFQLLQAMAESRRRNIPHGDLKSENVLVTSSLSVYITDFAASFKQVYLPLNDPSDFNFYFGTSGRRTCYLAPERFYGPDSDIAKEKARIRAEAANASQAPHGVGTGNVDAGKEKLAELFRRDGKVTEAMDVFGLGCVIAELWRDGAPMFTLMQLFKYREGQFDIRPALAEISDPHIRTMVNSMVSLDVTRRKTFIAYLSEARGECFHEIFYTFLHRYLTTLQRTTPRATVAAASAESSATATARAQAKSIAAPSTTASESRQSAAGEPMALFRAEADERIERLYEEWSIITAALAGDPNVLQMPPDSPGADHAFGNDQDGVSELRGTKTAASESHANDLFEASLCIPNIDKRALQQLSSPPLEDGPALLVLSPLLSNMRNVVRPSSKLHCMEMLLHLSARWLSDEAKLDRVLPYIIDMLDDESVSVRDCAVKSTVRLLALVDTITPSNVSTFIDYVMLNIRVITRDPSSLVRATYAACLEDLSRIGTRFLQMASAMRAEGVFAADADGRAGGAADDFLEARDRMEDEVSFNRQMEALRLVIQEEAVILLSDSSPVVKRSILAKIGPLCVFFGSALTNDVILSHMITFLNDRSWMLRQAFFDAIPAVAKVAGARCVEEYVLTLLLQALSDPEEFVVLHVLYCLSRIMQKSRSLISQSKVFDVVGSTVGFLCHPNGWLRTAACLVISMGARQIGSTEVWAILYPSVRPLLRCDIGDIRPNNLAYAASDPISREIFFKAIQWALRAKSSLFWKPQAEESKSKAGLANYIGKEGIGLLGSVDGRHVTRTPVLRNEEDDAYFDGLRSSGLNDSDEIKLIALREYILKVARASSTIGPRAGGNANGQDDNNLPAPLPIQSALAVQPLSNVTPLTIFFGSKADASGDTTELQIDGDLARPSLSGKSYTVNGSFSTRIARRRIGSDRIVSEASSPTPLEELRRRMISVSSAPALSLPYTPGSPSERADVGWEVEGAPTLQSQETAARPTAAQKARLGIGKAHAATASTSANVSGMMADRSGDRDHPRNDDVKSVSPSADMPLREKSKAEDAHVYESRFTCTYDGDDPYVRAHLEAIWTTAFQDRNAGLGPSVSTSIRKRGNLRAAVGGPRVTGTSATSGTVSSNRRPEGNLIAYFTEHSASISSLAVSPDHAFFVSGAVDGLIKVWDTARLEKNVTSRSRNTYSGQRGAITSLIMLDGSHCVASAATDGSVHVVRIEVSSLASASLPRYGKMRLVSNFQLSNPAEYVVAMSQSSRKSGLSTRESSLMSGGSATTNFPSSNGPAATSISGSTLILATSRHRIVTLDLRTMQVLSTLQNPAQMGSISVLCIDPKNIWLLVGTVGGALCLWDLRFQLLVKYWRVGHKSSDQNVRDKKYRINSIALHPSKGNGKWVMIAFENLNLDFKGLQAKAGDHGQVLLETWDIDRGVCVESYETSYAVKAPGKEQGGKRRSSTVIEGDYSADLVGLSSPAEAIQQLVKSHEAHLESGSNIPSEEGAEPAAAGTDSGEDASLRRIQGREIIPAPPPSAAVRALVVNTAGYASSALPHVAQVSGGWLDAGKLAKSSIGVDDGVMQGTAGGPAGYMLTGGLDRRIRFWDLGRADKSTSFGSSLEERHDFRARAIEAGEEERSLTGVQVDHKTSTTDTGVSASPIRIMHQVQPSSASNRAAASALRSPLLTQHATSASTNVLMRAHKDAVTALAIIESPFRCIVAGDYSGNIRVWE